MLIANSLEQAALAVLGGGYYNTESIKNAGAIAELLRPAADRMVDVFGNGDSLHLFGGTGDNHGRQHALLSWFEMYASGAHWGGENDGVGQDVGYSSSTLDNLYHKYRSGGSTARASGMPAAITNWWNSSLDPGTPSRNHMVEISMESTSNPATNGAKICGMTIGAGNPLGLTGLQFLLWAGKFNNTAYPSGSTMDWRQLNGGTNVTLPAYACTDSGATRVPVLPHVYTLTDQVTTFDIRRQGPGETTAGAYPHFFGQMRVQKTARTRGFSVHAGYAVGSSTSTQCLAYWNAMGASRLANVLAAAVIPQLVKGYPPYMIVEFAFGVNDASAGILASVYKQNHVDLCALYRTAWGLAKTLLISEGGFTSALVNSGRLAFNIVPTHPTTPTDSNISPYRTVAGELAVGDVAYTNWANGITSYTELSAPGVPEYDNPGVDDIHLETYASNDDSYSTLQYRKFKQVLGAPAAPVWVTSSPIPQWLGGSLITPINLSATHGFNTKITYSVFSGAWPSGISMTSAGVVSGTPSGGISGASGSVVIRAAKADDSTVYSDKTLAWSVSPDGS